MTVVREVRARVLHTLAAEGRAPSAAELAAALNLDRSAATSALRQLADEHAVVLAHDGETVRMAHPFTAWPMGFVVVPAGRRDGRLWWGGCAWDSFGVSAALGIDVRISTRCPHCGSHLSIDTGPGTPPPSKLAVRFPVPAGQWWDDVVQTCSNIRLFCSAEHATSFAALAPHPGAVVPASAVWSLAQPWYGDRLDPDYTPKSVGEKQRMLADVGLCDEFWLLERPDRAQ